MKIIQYYFDNAERPEKLIKTINICYETKYKLSEIAKLIIKDSTKIDIMNSTQSNKNYSGDNTLLKSLNIELSGLERSLQIYQDNYNY